MLPIIPALVQTKSTGQLSVATAFANFAGCIARIFTTLQEGGGMAMVRGYSLGELAIAASAIRILICM